jgi:hypothetical protein
MTTDGLLALRDEGLVGPMGSGLPYVRSILIELARAAQAVPDGEELT